ncbi:MAG: glutamine amidotransferase class-I [Gammaproteobacteria bacterium]|nr:MAG: glutamine amidotransferase class-I [Gammaproteobacteria bacterium]TND07341.1 MAG: glutamine amidotransferase class-I [Gammaproteobacteria bacterium]
MQPILVFRHIECEGPGFFGTVLDRLALPYRIIQVDNGEPVPRDCGGAAALVFMGGPMSVNDPLPWISAELALIRQAVDRNLPVLGHCLGGQLISRALGGEITRNPVTEIGWHDVTRVDDALTTDWRRCLPARFEAFHWHGETFSIPPGAQRILQSAFCPNQGFVINNALALQCHIEMTTAMVDTWADLYRHETATPSVSVQTRETMLTDLDERVAALQAVAEALYLRWLEPVLRGISASTAEIIRR